MSDEKQRGSDTNFIGIELGRCINMEAARTGSFGGLSYSYENG